MKKRILQLLFLTLSLGLTCCGSDYYVVDPVEKTIIDEYYECNPETYHNSYIPNSQIQKLYQLTDDEAFEKMEIFMANGCKGIIGYTQASHSHHEALINSKTYSIKRLKYYSNAVESFSYFDQVSNGVGVSYFDIIGGERRVVNLNLLNINKSSISFNNSYQPEYDDFYDFYLYTYGVFGGGSNPDNFGYFAVYSPENGDSFYKTPFGYAICGNALPDNPKYFEIRYEFNEKMQLTGRYGYGFTNLDWFSCDYLSIEYSSDDSIRSLDLSEYQRMFSLTDYCIIDSPKIKMGYVAPQQSKEDYPDDLSNVDFKYETEFDEYSFYSGWSTIYPPEFPDGENVLGCSIGCRKEKITVDDIIYNALLDDFDLHVFGKYKNKEFDTYLHFSVSELEDGIARNDCVTKEGTKVLVLPNEEDSYSTHRYFNLEAFIFIKDNGDIDFNFAYLSVK